MMYFLNYIRFQDKYTNSEIKGIRIPPYNINIMILMEILREHFASNEYFSYRFLNIHFR